MTTHNAASKLANTAHGATLTDKVLEIVSLILTVTIHFSKINRKTKAVRDQKATLVVEFAFLQVLWSSQHVNELATWNRCKIYGILLHCSLLWMQQTWDFQPSAPKKEKTNIHKRTANVAILFCNPGNHSKFLENQSMLNRTSQSHHLSRNLSIWILNQSWLVAMVL